MRFTLDVDDNAGADTCKVHDGDVAHPAKTRRNTHSTTITRKVVKPWIEEHIKCRQCTTFVATPPNQEQDDQRCGCGFLYSEHCKDVLVDQEKTWSYKLHTELIDANAYGRINFENEDGNHQPSFVKVAVDYEDTEKCKTVLKLFESKWNLPQPNLLISVTGGAKDFHVSPELLAEFKRGLMKAAKSTNAWVITGGTNTGVMKLVGEAVKGYSGSNVTAIGIATWGIIKNKACLIRPKSKKENKRKMMFDYSTKDDPASNEAYLDPNHSHFLLVDNGTQHKYGVEIAMRGAVEAAICQHYWDDYNIPNGEKCKLPMICILVEGGPNSIATCLAATRNGSPVLVLHGSGRSADIIAKAHSYSQCVVTYENGIEAVQRYLPDEYVDDIMLDINKHFYFMSQDKRDVLFESLKELIKYDNLLTIYRLQGDNNSNDFDNAILIAMIRSVNDAKAKMSQMMLAITWDRLQIAQDLILNRHAFEDHEMEQFLRIAIIQNRVGFVKKFLDSDADMKHYLTYKELASLYNTITQKGQTIGKVLLTRADSDNPEGKLTLNLIGKFLEEIIEGSYRSIFTQQEFGFSDLENTPVTSPYDQMVVFAAIMQYHDMALLFWHRCKEPIVTGLIAAKINWWLSDFEYNKLASDEDNAELLQKQGDEFEEFASEVVIECYRRFERKEWTMILTAPRKLVNNMNLIELAANINADNFVAESPIQSYLNHTWMGQIHHSTTMKKILFCFIPPLFLFLRYNKKSLTPAEKQAWERRNEKKKQKKQGIKSLVLQPSVDNPDVEQDCHDNVSMFTSAPARRKLNWDEAFFAYYKAPATKFILHFITYFIFLVFYAYTLLKHFERFYIYRGLTGFDCVLFLWVLGQIPSEWDQIMKQNPQTMRGKLSVHFKNAFNVLDVLGIVTYLLSFSLKIIADPEEIKNVPISGDFTAANAYHLINILAFLFLALRVIQVMEVSMTTGPKIIMIGKMMIDLAFFIFILVIFLVTYGICAQALESPNQKEDISFNRVYSVLLRPMLAAFGEIGLEDIQGDLISGHCDPDKTSCDMEFYDFIRDDANGPIPEVHYYVLQFLMLAYLLFVNILLMNLLIAIFSNTYAVIEEDSAKLWKVQWCSVVVEFRNKQPLPNPFSLIYYIVRFVRWIINLASCKQCSFCMYDEEVGKEVDYYDLTMRVSEAREEYTQHKEQEDEEGDIRRSLQFIKDKLIISQMNATTDNRLSRLKSQDARGADSADQEVLKIKHHDIHVDSRKSPYVGTDIARALVPDRYVAWEVSFPYNPTEYTEQNILKNADKYEVDPSDPEKAIGKFNEAIDYDGDKVDRISFCGTYHIADGKPLNPRGRTGLRGRGQLNRWGPNHTAEPIVTRWARDPAGKEILVEGNPVLEFVGIFLKESKKWAIPGGPIKHGELLTTALSREFSEDALGSCGADNLTKNNIMGMLKEHLALGIAVYKGYIDDPRNTDNAWVESTSINYHDSLGTSFSNFPLKVGKESEALNVEWISLDKNMDLYGNHEWVLEKVCFHRHAYNPFSIKGPANTPKKPDLMIVS